MTPEELLALFLEHDAILESANGALALVAPRSSDEALASILQFNREPLTHHLSALKWASGPHALSLGERALLTLHELSGGGPGYNLRCPLAMAPDADLDVLARSIDEIVERHPLLRSRYKLTEHSAFRFVSNDDRPSLKVSRVREWPDARRDGWIQERSMVPFSLEHDAPARFELLFNERRDGTEAVLLFVFHHAAVDYASIQLLVAELERAYQARKYGRAASLGPVARYDSRASREAQYLRSDRARRDAAYWKRTLPKRQRLLRLPHTGARSPRPTFVGLEFRRRMGPELTARLREYSRAAGVTPFVTAISAFAALLQVLSKVDAFAVGTTVDIDAERIRVGGVGYFVNTIPVAFREPAWLSLDDAVRITRQSFGEAFAHAALPFCRVVEELHPVRDPSTPLVFQVMLSWLRFAPEFIASPFEQPLLLDVLEPRTTLKSGVTHDLVLSIEDRGADLACVWALNPEAVDPEAAEDLAAHYLRLLSEALAAPDRMLSEVIAETAAGDGAASARERFQI